MHGNNNTKRNIVFAIGLISGLHTSISSAVIVDFEGGQFFDGTTLTPVSQLPTAVFSPNQYYLEDGFRHSAIEFNNPQGASHIHGNTFQGNRRSEIEADAGGAYFESDTGGAFSLNSWGQQFFNDKLTVTGIDGGNSFSVQLNPADYVFNSTNTIHTIDFLALDPRFSHVTRVEYWFTDSGRGELPPNFSSVAFVDNVNMSAANVSSVPLPPAILFFASGLMTLVARKRAA